MCLLLVSRKVFGWILLLPIIYTVLDNLLIRCLSNEADLRGCCYCKSKTGVHHPPGPGYLIGREFDVPNQRGGGFDVPKLALVNLL